MSQAQAPTLSVLSQNVQEPTQAQDYSYLVNLLKDHSNLIKDLQRNVASLNVRLEALERNNVVQEMVHENTNSTENKTLTNYLKPSSFVSKEHTPGCVFYHFFSFSE